jgi:hypothetical protein
MRVRLTDARYYAHARVGDVGTVTEDDYLPDTVLVDWGDGVSHATKRRRLVEVVEP